MIALQVHSNEEKMMRFAPGCSLLESRFAAKCCAMIALQVRTNYDLTQFAPGYFCSLYFLRSFPWWPLFKISENVRLRCPCQICNSSVLRELLEPRFPAKCCAMIALQEHTS